MSNDVIHQQSNSDEPAHSIDNTNDRQRHLAFVLDIDGCISKEGIPIPGSKEALRQLHTSRIPFVFCTNGGGQLESQRAKKLSATFDLPVSPEQVILSHTPLRYEVVDRMKDARVLVVGEHCGEVARSYGLTKAQDVREYGRRHPSLFPRRREVEDPPLVDDANDPVRAVLFFEDPEDLGEALQLVLDVLLSNGNPSGPRVLLENDEAKQEVEVWFTNPDLVSYSQFVLWFLEICLNWLNLVSLSNMFLPQVYSGLATHPRLTQGSYRMCLETLFKSATSSTSTSYHSAIPNKTNTNSTKAQERNLFATTVGKPTPHTGKTALSKLLSQCQPNTLEQDLEIWTVGDNPFSDVALAHTMGWNSALVKTGIWDGDVSVLECHGVMPTKIVDSMAILIHKLLPK